MSKAIDVLDNFYDASFHETEASGTLIHSLEQASHQLYLDLVGLIGEDKEPGKVTVHGLPLLYNGKLYPNPTNEKLNEFDIGMNMEKAKLRNALAEYFGETKV